MNDQYSMKKILTLLVVLAIVACQNESKNIDTSKAESAAAIKKLDNIPRLPIPEDEVLIKAVKENLEGLNNKDLAWAMGPLHTNSPFMPDPAYHIRGSFLVYDMNFQLDRVEIESKSDTACVALVVHSSWNDNERTYEPQQQQQRYTWKPEGDAWKIWKMEVIGSTPLWELQD